MTSRYSEGQQQWQVQEASNYTHPIDAQLFADRPLFHLLGNVTGQRLLDIGCGNGFLLHQLQSRGASVVGIDISRDMVQQVHRLDYEGQAALACVASADFLPFAPSTFDGAICSLTINNLSSTEMVKQAFRSAAHVLKSNGPFVISLPHPRTLNLSTRFRWTDWEDGQTQADLIPGEAFKRQIMGSDGSMISIVNYYWPKDVLINLASRASFKLDEIIEQLATEDELARYPGELDSIFARVPFFLVMRFVKAQL